VNGSSRDQSTPITDGQGDPAPAGIGLTNSETGEYEFELWQDDVPVAEVSSRDLERAFRDICHYAAMYGQDGPVKIIQVQRRAITFVDAGGEAVHTGSAAEGEAPGGTQ
jgi:hypothetical protein